MKTSRNDPCPCGSGKKYKACCKPRDEARARAEEVGATVQEWLAEILGAQHAVEPAG